MELFDVIKAIYSNDGLSKITDEDKEKNFFMVRRIIGAMYPMQCQFVNHKDINPVLGFDILVKILRRSRNVPQWIYDSMRGKKPKDILSNYTKDVVDFFYQKLELDSKTAQFLVENEPDKVKAMLDIIDSILSNKKPKVTKK